MRLMSFSATTEHMRDGSKTVTRRLDAKGFYMRVLKPGTLICAVEKGMGLKKGEKIQRIGVIEIVDVRRERLGDIELHDDACGYCGGCGWGWREDPEPDVDPSVECGKCYRGTWNDETALEGFPMMPGAEFVDLFCHINKCDADIDVTRIEFKHRPDLSPCCGGEKRVHPPYGDQGTTRHYVCAKCGEAV